MKILCVFPGWFVSVAESFQVTVLFALPLESGEENYSTNPPRWM
jgi:hypothetical protein